MAIKMEEQNINTKFSYSMNEYKIYKILKGFKMIINII